MHYGGNIRRIRLSKGVKATWMAERLGIHISTYSNMEAGRFGISLERASQIADLLGVSVEDILRHEVSESLNTGTEGKRGAVDMVRGALRGDRP